MTDQLSEGVVQPTDAQIDAQVRDVYVAQGPRGLMQLCRQLLTERAVPKAPLQAVPVARAESHGIANDRISVRVLGQIRKGDQLYPASPAEPVPVVASEPVAWMRAGANPWHGWEACAEGDPNGFPVYRATPQAEPAVAEQARITVLERWGRLHNGDWLVWERAEDGYWTPWHIAQAALDAALASQSTPEQEADALIEALKFYAEKQHFDLANPDAWDTVSGEPQNWWCDEAGTATVEDGSVAAAALAGKPLRLTEGDAAPVAPAQSAGQGLSDAVPPLVRLRFFRDLTDEQRLLVFKVFGVLPEGAESEAGTHYVQGLLLKRMCSILSAGRTAVPGEGA